MGTTERIVNIFQGLNNAVDPTSPLYKEGWAYRLNNTRIAEDLSLAKAPTVGTNTGSVPNSAKVEGANGITYSLNAGALSGQGSAISAAIASIQVSALLKGTRQESGIYYYMCTAYDSTNKRESLPSDVQEHWVDKGYDTSDVRKVDVPVLVGTATGGDKIRWYRSRCVKVRKGDTQQLEEIVFPTEFFYLGEVASGTEFNDYAHDSEIVSENNLYEGRGTAPPVAAVDAIGTYDGRMFYFVDNVCRWSSVGRPEEVPQNYELTILCTYSEGYWEDDELKAAGQATITLTQKPRLDNGIYSEAKMTISELDSKSPVRAETIGGKLWVWTSNTTGYIVGSAAEGYKYVHVSGDIGLSNAWNLITCAYGVFGADANGIWTLGADGPKRLSQGIIDIDTDSKDTYIAVKTTTFGVWCSDLNEYWWYNAGNKQIVYHADKGIFSGPYNLTFTNKVELINGIYQCHLTSSTAAGIQTLQFWLGQPTASFIKDTIDIEVFYAGNDGTVTAKTYHNSIASETDARESADYSHTANIGVLQPHHSGRFFEVKLTIPSGTTAPVIGLNYSANVVPRTERRQR